MAIRAAIETIERLLFEPLDPRRLGFCRVGFFFWYGVQLWVYHPQQYLELPPELWQPPLLLSLFGPPEELSFKITTAVLWIALLSSVLGFRTRLSTGVVAVLGAYVFGVVQGYGVTNFHFAPMILISWVLASSRCGHAVSIDALFGGRTYATDWAYRWPIKVSQTVLLVLMFTGGLRKVFAGNWLQQPLHNMEYWLRYKHSLQALQKGIDLPAWVLWPVDHWWALAIGAALLLALELGSPLAFFERPALLAAVVVGGLFSMQLTLAVGLKTLPSFPWLGAYLFFVPFERFFRKAPP